MVIIKKTLSEEKRLKRNKYMREWSHRNSDKAKEHVHRWCKNNPEKRKSIRDSWKRRNPAKVSASRARRRGLEWSISDDLYSKLREQLCYYCSKKITSLEGGLDRIDVSRGYTPDNVLPCCYSCNVTRNELYTVEEMKIMIGALLKYRQGDY